MFCPKYRYNLLRYRAADELKRLKNQNAKLVDAVAALDWRMAESDGWAGSVSTRYDFAGNVTATLESHTSPLGETHSVKTEYELSPRGEVLKETVYADGVKMSTSEYGYDELMRPTGRTTTGGNGTMLTESTEHDLRGWQTSYTAMRGGAAVYSQTLKYMTPDAGIAPSWTGLISEATTAHSGRSANSYGYAYDKAGRLTDAKLYSGGKLVTKRSEFGIAYDGNGNMRTLRRSRETSSVLSSDLAMSYIGNRLTGVTDNGTERPGFFEFKYDASGNMTKDGRKRLQISPNVLNLPMIVRDTVGTMVSTMTYTYLGDGTKAGARASDPDAGGHSGMRYRGSFVYDVTEDGVHSLQSIAVGMGRLIAVTGSNGTISFESDGFICDHLGNVAAVVNLSAPASTSTANFILEQNDYLPFGTRIGIKTESANRYRYAGKEEQDIAGMDLSLLDFGARYYDAYVGRWNAIDPLAEKYFGMSPYNYCGNDPVNFFDPDGKDRTVKFKKNSVIIKATIYYQAGQTNGEGYSAQDAVQNAVRVINNLNGITYEKDGIEYSVKFQLTAKSAYNLNIVVRDGESNVMNFSKKDYLALDENGQKQMGQTKQGFKCEIVCKEMKNMSSIIHEIFHLLGACRKQKGQDHERYADYGVMKKYTEEAKAEYEKGYIIDQQSVNEIIEYGM